MSDERSLWPDTSAKYGTYILSNFKVFYRIDGAAFDQLGSQIISMKVEISHF